MITKPSAKQRRPQATPLHSTPMPPAESDDLPASAPEEAPPREAGKSWLSRTEAAISHSEKRRVRRLRQAADSNTLPPAAIPQGQTKRVYISMRWFSGAIIVGLLVVMYLFSRDTFFISEIYVGGTHYLSADEIFRRSEVANLHLFWVNPAEVEAKLKADPGIADATVEVGWPPNMVQITITEREPAMVWEQAGMDVWVDVSGHVMYMRQDLPDLPKVIVEKPSPNVHVGDCPLQGMNERLGPGSCIDSDIVSGALQFKALYPNVTTMVYDPSKGLGFHDGNGWVLWFGNGSDIATKMLVYQTIYKTEVAQGKHLIEVNVSNPDAPYYSASQAEP